MTRTKAKTTWQDSKLHTLSREHECCRCGWKRCMCALINNLDAAFHGHRKLVEAYAKRPINPDLYTHVTLQG